MNKTINKIFTTSIFVFFFFVFLFTRSFMGIYILGYRIGELAILSAVLFLFLYFFLSFNSNIFKLFEKEIKYALYLILITFFLTILFSKQFNFDTYIFKASSYIWTLGYVFLGYLLSLHFKIKKLYINFSLAILIYIYYVAIQDLPMSVQDFFLSISDKYEPHKGSDILIMFVSILYLFTRVNNKRLSVEVLIIFGALFLPLLLYKSRGAFIALLIYLIVETFKLRKEILNSSFFRNLLLILFTLLLFFQSVFLVTGSGAVKINMANDKLDEVTQYRAPELKPGEYVNYLFFKDNRFYSTDVNINWRIQIWQDVIFDLRDDGKLLLGNGYFNKIPAMAALDHEGNSVRSGLDGLNENVHNNLVNIFARGGLVHLTLFLYLYYQLIKKYKLKFGNYDILVLMTPILFTSFFDASMENSHYPLIFYFLLGSSFNLNLITKNNN